MVTKVLVDANVLFSRTLRDWVILLELETSARMFKVHWTEDILAEVVYRTRRKHPTIPGGVVRSMRDSIAGSLEGGRVEDFDVDNSFAGVDRDDAHVHGAAVACGAKILLTHDKGFSERHPDPDSLPYDVYDADAYLRLVHDSDPAAVRAVTVRQAAHWMSRSRGKECDGVDLPQRLRDAGCPDFAEIVRRLLQGIQPHEFWSSMPSGEQSSSVTA
ncbi:PIN domain-containing protein [Litorihabitans aurantiacus]|uniref:PIN domain-containing protein n=1 Tax=Litorihabitans aurantiacus TaxID=1930061 RepID=A0AA37XHB5_9MICO|nr:PIN domain-containing protein [Litorihabitans aurantiacus]GMA33183.1 hypothetical protein GCM10025875_31750 [Litorihabitans aurantiacus]